jgi:hypothetical protein
MIPSLTMNGFVKTIVFVACIGCGPAAAPPTAAPMGAASSAPSPGPAPSALADAGSEDSLAKGGDCPQDEPYKGMPENTGLAPQLPAVPSIPEAPRKVGDAYTVFGASHALLSRFESTEVKDKEITIVGYIVASNLASAPACALHRKGRADPEGCVTELPSFRIADAKDAKTDPRINVLGWAANFASVFDAKTLYANGKPARPYMDDIFAVEVPYPLPAIGAKVRVTGRYGFSFTRSSTGVSSDPRNGILTYQRIEVLEPAPRPATLGR